MRGVNAKRDTSLLDNFRIPLFTWNFSFTTDEPRESCRSIYTGLVTLPHFQDRAEDREVEEYKIAEKIKPFGSLERILGWIRI